MAYENISYELVLNRMIDRVKQEDSNLDTREGSIIYNALASAAIELAIAYCELDNILKESFADTASREYLYRKCEEVGIDVQNFEASYSAHKGSFDHVVSIGSRWNCDLYNYTVTELIEEQDGLYTYKMVCETIGAAPNSQTGDLTPITDYISNLSYAQLTECLIEGEDEVSDDEIREIYYSYVGRGSSDGNVGQYKTWCDLYDGIGNYKIIPLWNGTSTVKVSILSTSNAVASDTLIEEFQNYLDPNSEGMGNGVAPIGSFVTVTTATEKTINISADIELEDGYSDTSVINTAVEKYFRDISYDKSKVSYINVGAAILNTNGVKSVSNLLINNGTQDITLQDEEIPVIGEAQWTVI